MGRRPDWARVGSLVTSMMAPMPRQIVIQSRITREVGLSLLLRNMYVDRPVRRYAQAMRAG